MVDEWLVKSAQKYNKQSLDDKDSYPAIILMPITTLEKIINWTFQSLPDEILVGMDPNPEIKNPKKIEDLYRGVNFQNKLFAGQGYILGEPHLVNRGDAFSVHHVPEPFLSDFDKMCSQIRTSDHPRAFCDPQGCASTSRKDSASTFRPSVPTL